MALLTQSGTGTVRICRAFADQVNNGPVILAALKMRNIQFRRLFPAQATTQEDPEQRSISFTFEGIRVRNLPERSCLFGGEPVAKTNAEVLRPFDSPNAGRKIRAEQAGISSFVCKAADGREPAVDRARRKLT